MNIEYGLSARIFSLVPPSLSLSRSRSRSSPSTSRSTSPSLSPSLFPFSRNSSLRPVLSCSANARDFAFRLSLLGFLFFLFCAHSLSLSLPVRSPLVCLSKLRCPVCLVLRPPPRGGCVHWDCRESVSSHCS